jgi:ribonuclease BN (tRNA processing enzyme)
MKKEYGLSLNFTIRGVRGSYPVPGPKTLRMGGNTTCLEVRAGQSLIIIDAGTGIIQLGDELLIDLKERRKTDPGAYVRANMFFSHMHHDHTQGFPFFSPVFNSSTRLHIFGPRMMSCDFQDGLSNALISPLFPVELSDMRAEKAIHNIFDRDIVLFPDPNGEPVTAKRGDDLSEYGPEIPRVHVCHSYAHPNGGSMVYRIECDGKSLVFASDVEGYVGGDQRLIHFSRNCDVLIHDAQYDESRYFSYPSPVQGFGHSTPEMAAMVARASGAKRLLLTHHDPDNDDDVIEAMEARAQRNFPNTQAAREGLKIEIEN